ncbi:PAS domain-containing hybrid sensor histidine kinase/response regulator [Aurantimonas sp. Leaf443]|uniref:hybrid sensor histidine kinase/response regulator n=1 Tax=Aurantimonas sp. Leaf443 TaxID=1736378 RepID=UPI0007011419|nr:PAS domain-containing hybrid sensor histidine kinase/response regulator [Aurantimonas sp. Leaf443]KQT82162.1 hypothetical protein ASG48_16085 [Aurantimonas sp. Leaf443]
MDGRTSLANETDVAGNLDAGGGDLFRAIANSIDQMVWSTRPDGFHDYYNDRWYEFTGVPAGSTDGEGWNGMFHPEDQEKAWAVWRQSLETGEPYRIEYRLRHRSGAYRWVLGRAQPIRDASGRIARWFGTCTDIQEIVDAREVLARSRDELEALVAERTADRDRFWTNSRDLIVLVDAQNVVRAASPSFETILGHPPRTLVGLSSLDLIHPDDAPSSSEALSEAFEKANLTDFENRYRHADGSYRWISWHTAREGDYVYGYGRDVTAARCQAEELATAQDLLRQAQKMEAVGQLTGGVAHDFNNLLQIITGSLDLILRRLPEDETRLRRAATNAMTGATRAAALTHRLLAFSRRQPLQPRPVEVNRLVTGMSELLERSLGATISIETVLAGGLWQVEADPNQLENAILNLAVNARDAMPDGGRLTIETGNSHLDAGYAHHHAEVTPGQYVLLSVTDTGTGMDAQTLSKVFEPFFTTKEVGKGTGLGLSQVYGFVKQSGGHVKLYSEPGQGTSVKIYLPRRLTDGAQEEEEAAQIVPGGSQRETILVLEDDEAVRAYSVEVLRDLGYGVVEAGDGPAALRILAEQGERIDLLFTDVVLPGGLDGAEVTRRARAALPDLKVLFTTGYARNAIVHQGRLDPGVALLTKPFTYADLATRVRDILDAP